MSVPYFMLVFFTVLFAVHFWELTFDRKTARAEVSVDRMTLPALGFVYLFTIAGGLYEFFAGGGKVNVFSSTLGFFLLAVRFALKYWAMKTLGGNWSSNVEIKESHTLVRNGPYSYLRHPVYFGRLVEVTAIALILKAPVTFLFSFSAHLILIWIRVFNEEKALAEKFGDEYAEYRRKTGGLLPKL